MSGLRGTSGRGEGGNPGGGRGRGREGAHGVSEGQALTRVFVTAATSAAKQQQLAALRTRMIWVFIIPCAPSRHPCSRDVESVTYGDSGGDQDGEPSQKEGGGFHGLFNRA